MKSPKKTSINWSLALLTVGYGFLMNTCMTETKEFNNSIAVVKVHAKAQTTPVSINDDAADDPVVWINAYDSTQSLIFGTNKKKGIEVYDLQGNRVAEYPVGCVNNIDLRYNFILGHDTVDLIGATNRTTNTLSFFVINSKTGALTSVGDSSFVSKIDPVYGFTMYQSKHDSIAYAFAISKKGQLEQWILNGDDGDLTGEIVRTYDFGNICEGLVADDYTGYVYIAEEDKGIWKWDINPNSNEKPQLIVSLEKNTKLKDDIEGIALYYTDETKGYLIASSQGNNTYAIFERTAPHKYRGSFAVVDGSQIDGTEETDGLDVLNLKLPGYPNGILVIQDGYNMENGDTVNQNFKIVDWSDVAKGMNPPLDVSSEFDALH
jgi:3-phytase